MSLRGLETAIFSRGYQPRWEWAPGDHPDYDKRILHSVDSQGNVKHTLEYQFKARGAHTKEANYYEHCKMELFKMADELTRGEPAVGGIPG